MVAFYLDVVCRGSCCDLVFIFFPFGCTHHLFAHAPIELTLHAALWEDLDADHAVDA